MRSNRLTQAGNTETLQIILRIIDFKCRYWRNGSFVFHFVKTFLTSTKINE